MSETPRQNAHASRLARRQSPYTRPAPESAAAPSTPSRLRSLLSYVSPFRSGRKLKADAEAEAANVARSEQGPPEAAAGSPGPEVGGGEHRYSAGSASTAAQSTNWAFTETGTSTSTTFQAPTAFTPHFRPDKPTHDAQGDGPARDSLSEAPAGPVVRRKRPLYVGAGYTGRRKRTGRPTPAEAANGIDVSAPAIPGKRRRLVADDLDGAPPTRSDNAFAFASVSGEARTTVASPRLAGSASESVAFPRSPAGDAAHEVTAPRRNATRAADLVMDILRSEMPQRPDATTAARREHNATRILNPYDTDENVLSLAGSSARTASRATVPQRAQAPADAPKQARERPQVKETAEPSPTELLQRTMPAAYRRETLQQNRAQQETVETSPKPSTARTEKQPAVVAKPKRQVAVVEILSSDEEETSHAESASETRESEGEGYGSTAPVETSDQSENSNDEAASDEEADDAASEDAEVMVIDSDEESRASPEPEPFQPSRKPEDAPMHPPGVFSAAHVSPASLVSGRSSARHVPARTNESERTSSGDAVGDANTGDLDASTGPADASSDRSASRDVSADGAALPASLTAARDAALNQPRASLPLDRFTFAQVLLHGARAPASVEPTLVGVVELAKSVSRGELPLFSL